MVGYNKLKLEDDTEIFDLTDVTAEEEDVTEGKTFYKADGTKATGTLKGDSFTLKADTAPQGLSMYKINDTCEKVDSHTVKVNIYNYKKDRAIISEPTGIYLSNLCTTYVDSEPNNLADVIGNFKDNDCSFENTTLKDGTQVGAMGIGRHAFSNNNFLGVRSYAIGSTSTPGESGSSTKITSDTYTITIKDYTTNDNPCGVTFDDFKYILISFTFYGALNRKYRPDDIYNNKSTTTDYGIFFDTVSHLKSAGSATIPAPGNNGLKTATIQYIDSRHIKVSGILNFDTNTGMNVGAVLIGYAPSKGNLTVSDLVDCHTSYPYLTIPDSDIRKVLKTDSVLRFNWNNMSSGFKDTLCSKPNGTYLQPNRVLKGYTFTTTEGRKQVGTWNGYQPPKVLATLPAASHTTSWSETINLSESLTGYAYIMATSGSSCGYYAQQDVSDSTTGEAYWFDKDSSTWVKLNISHTNTTVTFSGDGFATSNYPEIKIYGIGKEL